MLKKVSCLLLVGVVTQSAYAWEDVDYTGTLATGAVYCTSESNLMDFGAYAQDGDEAGADRMISGGDCIIAQRPMQAMVIQEVENLACFLSPSGKPFYTFKQFIN